MTKGNHVPDECPSNRRFLTIEQVAEELSVKPPQIRALLKSGELRGIQVGGRGLWRIGMVDLEDYIAQAYRSAGARFGGDDAPDDKEGP